LLGHDEQKALLVHEAVLSSRHDGFRGSPIKERAIKIAIKKALPELSGDELKGIFEIIKNQNEY
jgi:type I restriction enzyme R subunit